MQFYIPGTHISIHKHVPHSASFYEVVEEDVLDEDCNTHVRVSDIFKTSMNNNDSIKINNIPESMATHRNSINSNL